MKHIKQSLYTIGGNLVKAIAYEAEEFDKAVAETWAEKYKSCGMPLNRRVIRVRVLDEGETVYAAGHANGEWMWLTLAEGFKEGKIDPEKFPRREPE